MRNKLAAVALFLLLVPGCAWMNQGTTQEVKFVSTPSGASFKVRLADGTEKVLETPTTQTLAKGEQSIIFTRKDYKPLNIKLGMRTNTDFYWSILFGIIAMGIDLATGSWKEFDLDEKGQFAVQLDPTEDNPEQIIKISSEPRGAAIKVAGFNFGLSGDRGQPAVINLYWKKDEREKQLTLTKEDFQVFTVPLLKNQRSIHAVLERKPWSQEITFESNPPGAIVLIGGQPYPKTPVKLKFDWKYKDASTEVRIVEFRLEGYRVAAEKFKSTTERVAVNLEEIVRPTSIVLDCLPVGSSLEVDEVAMGEAPAAIKFDWSVSRASRRLRFSRPGYESQELVVDEKMAGPIRIRLKPSLPRLP